jgi:hypothetical protein
MAGEGYGKQGVCAVDSRREGREGRKAIWNGD